jgi:hypothetical protein
MVHKYLAIEFTGSYSNVLKFFEAKGWTFEIKNVGNNRLLLKISDELAEEVVFFKNTIVDEVNGDKISTVKISF